MKRILMVFLFISLFFITACDKKDSIFIKDISIDNEVELNFMVKDTILSKSFNNLEPFVDLVRRDENINLLVSLGLLDTSGIKVNDITIDDDLDIYIHVSNVSRKRSNELSVPQIQIDLYGKNINISDNTNFYIIKENYDNIDLRFNLPEILTKVNSQFNLNPATMPSVQLLKEDDTIIWDINYFNVVDIHNLEVPIIDLSLQVDAQEGNVISTSKRFISSLVDHGYILDYSQNNNILYQKQTNFLDSFFATDLYVYDSSKQTSQLIYSNTSDISKALFSPSGNSLIFLDLNSNLFFSNTLNTKPSMVDLKGINGISHISWITNEDIMILNAEKDLLYFYNLIDKKSTGKTKINFPLNSIDFSYDYFILEDSREDLENSKIHLTRDFLDYDLSINGFKADLFNEDKLVYLQHLASSNSNSLNIYSLREKKPVANIDTINIKDYFVIDSENLGIIENLGNQNIYNYYEYNFNTDELTLICSLNSPSIFLNRELNLLYSNLQLGTSESPINIFYSIDLDKLYKK